MLRGSLKSYRKTIVLLSTFVFVVSLFSAIPLCILEMHSNSDWFDVNMAPETNAHHTANIGIQYVSPSKKGTSEVTLSNNEFLVKPQKSKEVPLFTPNEGQFPPNVWAKAQFNNHVIWFAKEGIWFQFFDESDLDSLHDKTVENSLINTEVVRMTLKNGKLKQPLFTGTFSTETYNYFIGNNAENWVSDIRKSSKLTFEDVYKGIDLEFIAEGNAFKYNWILKNGADLKSIQVQYEGAQIKQLDPTLLHVHNGKGRVFWEESIPLVYNANKPDEIAEAAFQTDQSGYKIQLIGTESSQNNKEWVIDPMLVFSTYSGSLADNFGCTGTYDHLGNAYSGGTVFNFGLPTTTGAYQVDFAGGKNENLGYGGSRDVAILKFNTIGNSLLYCTYLGGNNNEQPHSMVVDSQFNLFVMGTTRSVNFPTTKGAYDTTQNGDYDYFVSRFNVNGTLLLGSTFLGSAGLDGVGADRSNRNVNDFPLIYNYADEFRGEIIEDNNGIYVGGVTYSTNFPHTVSVPYPTTFSSSNGVMFSFTKDLTNLRWSHVIGTQNDNFEAIYGVAINDSGIIYGAGGAYTSSVTVADYQNKYGVNWNNSFVTSDVSSNAILIGLNKQTGTFQMGALYGTSEYDQAYFVQTDNSGRPYIYGQTEGNMLGINARFHDDRNNGQFITRFNRSLKNIELQSCFGANGNMPNLSPSAFLIDRCERIFISGWGGNTNQALYDVNTGNDKILRNRGNTRNLPLSADAIQKQTDGSDFYIAVFAKDMYELAFATYFGGISRLNAEAEEHVDGGTSRFDKKGIIYQSLCGGCRQNGVYPTTPGAWSRTMPSSNCNNALFKIDVENLNRKPAMNNDFVEVIAEELMDFQREAFDPDLLDTVRMIARIRNKPNGVNSDTPVISTTDGIGKATFKVYWPTTCNSVSSDTIYIDIMIYDCGCPTADTIYRTIKLLVKPPPLVDPPDAICVLFERFQNRMRVEWPAQTSNAAYLKYFLLIKTLPNGTQEILDTIRNNTAGFYIDNQVVDPHLNNYCYELIAVNVCDKVVNAPYKWCSVSSLNAPLTPVHLISASVFDDKGVEVKWEMSKEPDFKDFEVYKYKKNLPTKPGFPYLVTSDTFLLDSSFDVDEESYCYEIIVTDKCGLISNASNPGCNVVLKGNSKYWPDPYFDLNWDDYRGWENGVLQWEVERRFGNKPQFDFLATGSSNRTFRDKELDYDWGGYEFRVRAKEWVQGNQIDYNAESLSNWIYLIQPPEVWVPDAFTVNQDGINENWGTFPLFVKNYSMKVYDRWGAKIWESTDKKQQWGGLFKDQQVPDGVYAWLLTFDGWDNETYQKTGTVIVLH